MHGSLREALAAAPVEVEADEEALRAAAQKRLANHRARISLVQANAYNRGLELRVGAGGHAYFLADGVRHLHGLTRAIAARWFNEGFCEQRGAQCIPGPRSEAALVGRFEPPEHEAERADAPPADGVPEGCRARGREHGAEVARDLALLVNSYLELRSFEGAIRRHPHVDRCVFAIVKQLRDARITPIASEWLVRCDPLGLATAVDVVGSQAHADCSYALVHVEVKTTVLPHKLPYTPALAMRGLMAQFRDSPLNRAQVQCLVSELMLEMSTAVPRDLKRFYMPDASYVLFVNPRSKETALEPLHRWTRTLSTRRALYEDLLQEAVARDGPAPEELRLAAMARRRLDHKRRAREARPPGRRRRRRGGAEGS